MEAPILEVEALTKTFVVHRRGARIEAVRGLGFVLRAGELAVLTGPSGAGKTTVLRCIHRTCLPSAGRVILHGGDDGPLDLATCDEHRVIAARRRDIGFVTQFLHCLPRRPTLDVVAEPLALQGVPRTEARDRAAGLLERLGIPRQLWELPPATFSGGEKQRVNVARGFARASRLLLLDEPTASLDRDAADRVLGLIQEARRRGAAILAICHDQSQVERLAARRIAMTSEVGDLALDPESKESIPCP